MSQKAIQPTEFEKFEKVNIPQKLYYRKGSLHTVASEIKTKNCALFVNPVDLEVMKLVEKEMSVIPKLERIYPMILDAKDEKLAKMTINSIIGCIDTVVAIGSSKLFNEIAQVLAEHNETKQLVVIPTDGKPLALVCGVYADANGKVHQKENLIPEFVILDSGITHNITDADTKMLAEVASVEEDTQMVQWTRTAKQISTELIAGYGKIDHPVWCERATNLVGITMLGKPDGARVLKVLGLIQ